MNRKITAALAAIAIVVAGVATAAPATASSTVVETDAAATAITAGRDSHIVYSKADPATGGGKIFVAYADLSKSRVVATYPKGELRSLRVSANGRYLAYQLQTYQIVDGYGFFTYTTIVRDLVANKVVRTIEKKNPTSYDYLIDISPDGSQLLRKAGSSYYLTKVSTGVSTKLALGTGQEPTGFTPDGGRLILERNASNRFTITRYNIATKGTAVVASGTGVGGVVDVSPDGSVIYERSGGCSTAITPWSVRTDGSASAKVATTRDRVWSASPNGKWLIAVRASAPRKMECEGGGYNPEPTYTIMSRDGKTLASKTLVARWVDWSKPALSLG